MNRLYHVLFLTVAATLVFVGCSTTSNIPDDDQLFTGLTKINYENYESNDHFLKTQIEVEAALATAPNGALFGSSYYRTPFPYGLWIWNAFAGKEDAFSKWMVKSFGKQPVLMSWVNPSLRASVAQTVLRNYGYVHSNVNYEVVQQKNPKKAKIGYNVNVGELFTVDTLEYVNFPNEADSLIRASKEDALVKEGTPLSVPNLDGERQRLYTLFRDNGYYYYQSGYASYVADTLGEPNKASLRLQLASDLPQGAMQKWHIGNIHINMKRTYTEPLTDSLRYRFFSINYNGKKPPLRPRVVMRDMKIRHNALYNYSDYQETVNHVSGMGLFSAVDFRFSPRDTTASCDTLDLTLDCVLDRPYDVYFEGNFKNKTIGRMGPEIKAGIVRRNAFRGGEKLDLNIHGSYAWESHKRTSSSNYEYGIDASLEFPRIVAPFYKERRRVRDKNGKVIRRRFFSQSSSLAKLSTNTIYRPEYYRMDVLSGEWTYRWQTSPKSVHEFSPLVVKYQFSKSHSAKLDSLMEDNMYISVMMDNQFVPQMRYTYTYSSPATYLNPIRWETTVAEAGNLLSLGYAIAGRGWNEADKKFLNTEYSQFIKLETDFRKTWTLDQNSQLLAHVNAGVLYNYGNGSYAPFSEMFYVGGANSLRAFPIRGIGPGGVFQLGVQELNYVINNGDIKLVANLEYRRKLFGSLSAALFIDVGNVWNFRKDYEDDFVNSWLEPGVFKFDRFFRQLAVGTGVGIRYDLDFLVLRLDWGVGLHLPYDTGKNGFYNIDSFKDNQTLHFAIGYPF